jgi:hypothetical protein
MIEDKWVRVMCDFSAEGLWRSDGASIDSSEIPISQGLKDRLRAWQDNYEKNCEVYLPPSEQKRHLDLKAFSDEGREIARAIKAELPDWTVVYFDEAKRPDIYSPGQDRSVFEYKITRL